LIVGTGMSGHGFGIGPAMGRILADMAAGRPSRHDLSRFRFNRFTDGTQMVLGPDV
jgi:glycine/D-amino acid oxidase-like deaminating enzyme